MTSVVLVHGTGVRTSGYDRLFRKVTDHLGRLGSDVRLVPCAWGEEHGARLRLGGASLPGRPFGAGPEAEPAGAEEDDLASWGLLDADPLAELSALAEAERQHPSPYVPPQGVPAPERLVQLLRALPDYPGTATALAGLGLTGEEGARAADLVAKAVSSWFRDCAVDADVLREAAARAVVAGLLSAADERWGAAGTSADGETVDALLAAVLGGLGGPGAALGVVSSVTRQAWLPFLRGGEWLTSWRVRSRRRELADSIAPPIGDILRYQARGEGLRACIAAVVAAAEPPVVVLAHSLGGVACVDLFAQQDHSARVAALVTVGSQAPFLYEMDALVSLPVGRRLPAFFPGRWLNAYDPRDPLAYVARPVFQDGRITDRAFDTRRPLLRAHSAYWDHAPLYAWLDGELFR